MKQYIRLLPLYGIVCKVCSWNTAMATEILLWPIEFVISCESCTHHYPHFKLKDKIMQIWKSPYMSVFMHIK